MLAIRNFGHFWNRDLVDWGRPGPGARGTLQGYVMRDREPFVVDFREQMGIYVLFTGSRDVVYIGQAGAGEQRLWNRLRSHTRNHPRDRWQHFSWFGLREVNLSGGLDERRSPTQGAEEQIPTHWTKLNRFSFNYSNHDSTRWDPGGGMQPEGISSMRLGSGTMGPHLREPSNDTSRPSSPM